MADPNSKPTPDEPVYPKWFYERSRTFTGLVQFRSDVGDRTADALGFVRRGEVRKVTERFASRAVEGGWFSHVPEGTPIGQPDEYKPKPKVRAETATDDAGPSDEEIRAALVRIGHDGAKVAAWTDEDALAMHAAHKAIDFNTASALLGLDYAPADIAALTAAEAQEIVTSNAPKQSATDSGPQSISADQWASLIDLGATDEEIRTMTPQQAHERLSAPKE